MTVPSSETEAKRPSLTRLYYSSLPLKLLVVLHDSPFRTRVTHKQTRSVGEMPLSRLHAPPLSPRAVNASGEFLGQRDDYAALPGLLSNHV